MPIKIAIREVNAQGRNSRGGRGGPDPPKNFGLDTPDCRKSAPNSINNHKFSKFSPAAGSSSSVVRYTFLDINKSLNGFDHCLIAGKSVPNLIKNRKISKNACGEQYPFGFPWNINWFQPLPDYWLTGKVIMCHDTIYFESLFWGIGHRITVFSWKFDICSFVGLSITKTPPFFKKLGGYDPRSRCSPTERSARLACFARMTTPLALCPP